jgi:hypothetical protein
MNTLFVESHALVMNPSSRNATVTTKYSGNGSVLSSGLPTDFENLVKLVTVCYDSTRERIDIPEGVRPLDTQKQKDYYTAGEAAQYLAKKWDIRSYSTTAFRLLRWRWDLQPDMHLGNASLWKQETLDAIPKPDRSKPRPKKEKRRPMRMAPLADLNTPGSISEENIPDEQAKKAEKQPVDSSDVTGE